MSNPFQSPIAHETAAPHALLGNRSFHALTVAQFLGAFNDNLFKQLMLLIFAQSAVSGVAEAVNPGAAGASPPTDLQPHAMFVFSLPFLMFSGFAGWLADRTSKRRIIVLCKASEIVIMSFGVLAFAIESYYGLVALLGVLCLMGTHSALFGPSKYGILPEMVGSRSLPHANGIIQMTTFLAIIFGTAGAGMLKKVFEADLWMAGCVCVAIACVGTTAAAMVRPTPVARRGLPFSWGSLTVPRDIWALLRQDRVLVAVLIAYSLFWMVGAVAQQAVNAYGLYQLKADDLWTSVLVAGIGLGIATGCAMAGALSRGEVSFGLVRGGAAGLCGCFAILATLGLVEPDAWVYWISFIILIVAGGCCGLLVVPLQVFLQYRPPEHQKGRMIGTQNLGSWIGVISGAGVYFLFSRIRESAQWPASAVFGFSIILLVPLLVWFRPANQSLEAEAQVSAAS